MRKIRAYTLMEVTVAMLLSAICIGICYSAYGIIEKYYAAFQQKNEKASELLALRGVLTKDFLKANLIMNEGEAILLQQDSLTVYYSFYPAYILRKHGELKTDTFKLASKERYLAFEGTEVLEVDTIDVLKFSIELDAVTPVPLIFNKHYSAQNLFK